MKEELPGQGVFERWDAGVGWRSWRDSALRAGPELRPRSSPKACGWSYRRIGAEIDALLVSAALTPAMDWEAASRTHS